MLPHFQYLNAGPLLDKAHGCKSKHMFSAPVDQMDRNPSTKTWYQSFLTNCNTMQPPPVLRREDVQVYLLKLLLDCRFFIGLLYSGETDFSDSVTTLHPTSDDLHFAVSVPLQTHVLSGLRDCRYLKENLLV